MFMVLGFPSIKGGSRKAGATASHTEIANFLGVFMYA
jgi:hypothetical protein